MLGPLVRTLRPAQWAKNVFVLAPLFLAQRLGDPQAVRTSAVAFVAFCLASSAVYIINDIRDRDEDSRHPLKKHRPIAAGQVSPMVAGALAAGLLAITAVLAWPLGTTFVLLTASYLVLNLLYSSGLKRIVILDVMILSVGFVLRVAGGAAAIRVEVSSWLFLSTIFLALFLAFSKRRHELVLLAEAASDQRRVLTQYSETFLDQMINVVTASCVISYALYATDPETVAKIGTKNLVLTVPLVLFGIFRYLYLVYQQTDDRSPTEVLLHDVPFLVNVVLWGLAVLWIVYGGGGAFSTLE
jgi:4-hydroxybenzoate polyprenyltransferase